MDKQIAPEKFNKQCASVLSKYVYAQDELIWERNGLEKVTFTCRNKINPISSYGSYLLRVKSGNSLLVHCDLTYIEPDRGASVGRRFTFLGASLQFYYEADFCFCRAEWDVKDKPDKLEHPQPHWHWGLKIGGGVVEFDTADVAPEFMIEDNPIAGIRKPGINFSELHYAMSSKWLDKGENSLSFSFQNLTKWMENALVMVIDQYNYQVSKRGFVSVRR